MAEQARTDIVQKQGIIQWASQTFGVDAGKVLPILKETAFAQGKNEAPATDAEVAALLIVSREYGLNPFTRQIYAFKNQRGGIVPIVGIDGWASVVNGKEDFDGVEFEFKEDDKGKLESCTCVIYRKDRNHPTKVTEFLAECYRETQPWKTMPRRMLRHKAFMQCGRLAFGLTGLNDEEEAREIVAGGGTVIPAGPGEIKTGEHIPANRTTELAGDLARRAATVVDAEDVLTHDEIGLRIVEAKNQDDLAIVLQLITKLPADDARAKLMQGWNKRVKELAPENPQPPQEKGKKSKGTEEEAQRVIARMREAANFDKLDEVADLAATYSWDAETRKKLGEEYEAAKSRIEG